MLRCSAVRTTLTIDDALYREIKALAGSTGRTVGSVVEDALRAELSRRGQASAPAPPMPVSPGTPLPGVDLDDGSALLDLMESG